MTNDRLTAFIYLLGRDHLPLGVIEKVMQDVEGLRAQPVSGGGLTPQLSNWNLGNFAMDVARRLAP